MANEQREGGIRDAPVGRYQWPATPLNRQSIRRASASEKAML
jgi:hypothetical protein